MRLREMLTVNNLVMVVLLSLLAAGEGCTHVVHSNDPNWEYPTGGK